MKKISIAIMVLVVALASCKKTPEVNLKYVDVERDLITVGTITATVQCDYQYIATLKKAYLYYGEGAEEVDMNAAEMRVVQNTLYVDLAGLKSNTTYSYFYEFHNGFNSMRTVAKTFKTEALPTTVTLPTVVTASVTEITTNSAKGGGEVTDNGGAEVTERGICWSTNDNPTLNDNHVAVGSGTGAFTTMMDGLDANTTYHVRAYAINEVGTAYGLDREFVTLSGGGGSGVPEGAIDGLFSVSPTQKVYFSQGNLQYQASTNTWRFAEHQWDYVGTQTPNYYGYIAGTVDGSDNINISPTYSGWIDLFGWGTSGWDCGNSYYHPWDDFEQDPGNAEEYGLDSLYGPPGKYNLTGSYANSDWGVYNAIINGGNSSGIWRSLSIEEWDYLLYTRSTFSDARFASACVSEVNGMILLPDSWNLEYFNLNSINQSMNYSDNIISSIEWDVLEQFGAVFLPAAGIRGKWYEDGIVHVYNGNITGDYWSISCSSEYNYMARILDFYGYAIVANTCLRSGGCSVRLVQDAN